MPVEEGKLDLDAQVPGLFNRPSGDCRLVDVIRNMIRRSEPGHSTWRLTWMREDPALIPFHH
jgi:hypothetical protein